ncbi:MULTISPECIES: hypothetical protein [Enterobacterales]|uniref:hypothetical protein n=2 Tax=Gammaproteobacteria TaxID=1236 RepID=UPI00191671B0|nr:hypothetical protein [Escherichia coli]MCK0823410.1 hypothetical protein [Escherichia coli]
MVMTVRLVAECGASHCAKLFQTNENVVITSSDLGDFMRDVLHDKAMTTVYRDDESYAETVLAAVIADGDQAELAILLRQLALIGTDCVTDESTPRDYV